MKTVVYDIEADALLYGVTMMSVTWTYHIEEDEWIEWREHQVSDLVDYLNSADYIVGHNIESYDDLALHKLTGKEITATSIDTMVISRLRNPDRWGGHSLRAWGIRLGVLKGTVKEDDEDDIAEVYGVYSAHLSEYCKQDVLVTLKLFEYFKDKGVDVYSYDWNPVDWEVWQPCHEKD